MNGKQDEENEFGVNNNNMAVNNCKEIIEYFKPFSSSLSHSHIKLKEENHSYSYSSSSLSESSSSSSSSSELSQTIEHTKNNRRIKNNNSINSMRNYNSE